MPKTAFPKTKVLPTVRVTEEQNADIRARAAAARMSLAEYIRRRSLGDDCKPREPAFPKS